MRNFAGNQSLVRFCFLALGYILHDTQNQRIFTRQRLGAGFQPARFPQPRDDPIFDTIGFARNRLMGLFARQSFGLPERPDRDRSEMHRLIRR